MFGQKRTANTFIDSLSELTDKTAGKTPKTLHNSFSSLLKKTKGFEGQTLDELVTYLTTKKRLASKSNSESAKSKLRSASKALTAEILTKLQQAETNEFTFAEAVAEAKKTCGAATLRDVAAEYAAIAKPRTKADAIKSILSARASRLRMDAKRAQSGKTTPW